jgi:hypothetical protein
VLVTRGISSSAFNSGVSGIHNNTCANTGSWADAFHMIDIVVPHTYNAGDITVRIYNTLN